MRNHSPFALFGCIAVASLIMGYFLRFTFHSVAADDQAEIGTGNGDSLSRSKTLRPKLSRFQKLKHQLEEAKGAPRWLHLVAKVEGAPLDDLAQFASLVKSDEMALRLIAQYWMERNPQHLFETLLEKSQDEKAQGSFPYQKLSSYLFQYWRKTDPEAVIAALSRSDGLPGRHIERSHVGTYLMMTDPKRGIELSGEWGAANWYTRGNSTRKWAQKDPRAAAEVVFKNAIGRGVESHIRHIAEVWASSDPEAALGYMISQNNRLSRLAQETILGDWARRDFDAASDWLEAQDDSTLHSRLTPKLIEIWGAEDPVTALSWCREHLEGSVLTHSVKSLIKGAVSKDIKLAADLVTDLKPSQARVQAGIEVAEAWFPQSVPSPIKVTPEAIEWVTNLNDIEMQGKILDKISWGWGEHDRDSLISFLSGPYSTKASDYTFRRAAREMVGDDPESALQWAAELPEGRSERIADYVFESWLRNQPKLAGDWLKKLPQTDVRRSDLVKSYIKESVVLPEEILFQRLSLLKPGDTQIVEAVVGSANIPAEKKQRILGALPEQR